MGGKRQDSTPRPFTSYGSREALKRVTVTRLSVLAVEMLALYLLAG